MEPLDNPMWHALARPRAEGAMPMLHVADGNTAAIRIYERLGFTRRATFEIAVVSRA